jgi:hypothetical protein
MFSSAMKVLIRQKHVFNVKQHLMDLKLLLLIINVPIVLRINGILNPVVKVSFTVLFQYTMINA